MPTQPQIPEERAHCLSGLRRRHRDQRGSAATLDWLGVLAANTCFDGKCYANASLSCVCVMRRASAMANLARTPARDARARPALPPWRRCLTPCLAALHRRVAFLRGSLGFCGEGGGRLALVSNEFMASCKCSTSCRRFCLAIAAHVQARCLPHHRTLFGWRRATGGI